MLAGVRKGIFETLEIAITAQVLTEAFRCVEIGNDAARGAGRGVAEAGGMLLILYVGFHAFVGGTRILGLDLAASVVSAIKST